MDLNLLQLILDYAAVDILTVDSRLNIVEWSEGANQYASYPLNKGSKITECLPELIGQEAKLDLVRLGATKTYDLVHRRTTEEGINLHYSIEIEAYLLPGTLEKGLVCLLRNHDEEAILLKEQQHQIDELKQVKSTFLAIASHELRAPLTNAISFMEMVLDSSLGEMNEQQRQFLNTADRNLKNMLSMINNLLEIERLESGMIQFDLTTFDLLRYTRNLVDFFAMDLQKRNLNIIVESDGAPSYLIKADMGRVEQVMNNLLSNAIKYSRTGGSAIVIRLEKHGGHIITHITDSGIGIPETDQQMLFQRFYRASNATQEGARGSGLGLSVVKAVVEQLNGKVWVTSKVGEGSTFSLSLPSAESNI
ncbi:MAG: HAMP domain-containing histidine kinase [Chloroflexi bacterium]|uniref:histidine kinase n=1 Tax=Candidatus Chlorohelix allophototropha TaxID=3003348 RepID=A0A8T7LTJ9_9CHLR|nr:HAMP domain-containing histidine kinase [Chloroflexota bacterium]WJW67217.1 HAMP domain-containing histidine kinase [Chloroflexota bacterium L227-S17]